MFRRIACHQSLCYMATMVYILLSGCSGARIIEDEIRDPQLATSYEANRTQENRDFETFEANKLEFLDIDERVYEGLCINEVVAKGETNDWVELYNQSSTPIALSGVMITDDLNIEPYIFDESWGEVEPFSYIVVEITDVDVGFKLGSDEAFYLLSPRGVTLDYIDWNEGEADAGTSLARAPDGYGNFLTVDSPSPGAPNQESSEIN